MGLSLSLLLSAWNDTVSHQICSIKNAFRTVILRSLNFNQEGEVALRTNSFKNKDIETIDKFDSDKTVVERSISFQNCESEKLEYESSNTVLDKESSDPNTSESKTYGKVEIMKPTISRPQPVILFSPRPVGELDAAATKLQKVYKSYRTRRNLADCAVVVEELWWKALDFAALKRSSVSFFNIEKSESAGSRWARARTRAAKVGKGLSKDEKAQKLALQHWLEAIDPRHRYGHNLHFYYDIWSDSKSTQPFFYWLDIGDGKELNIERCPRLHLQRQCISYLGPKEREAYQVVVDDGKLVYLQTGMVLNTVEGSKWIFVLSTSRVLYVGQKKKGVFQHSSFLSGGATTAAGRLVARDGVLEAIWPYSGHYLPTEDNFKEFISFLEEQKVDLTNVKRYAVDDDSPSFRIADEESKVENVEALSTTATCSDKIFANTQKLVDNKLVTTDSQENSAANEEVQLFDFTKRLSCKWTSGVGPRIGCVRDYPTELQSQALEQVNLSPKVTARHFPIPSPRPSPNVRLSPRLAYMGLPSPRPCVPSSNC